ncbi:hypothetical protein [Labrys wisconsinensis]|uniref:Na+/glutamate symporter n=1 Tax=Labrys wisconsinensis TaxID=425677 RepID=A0ABU0J1R0_9HYPH|nr:hypothetical protein [Labrys wisconsinensis]MDQ0468190.1 Na+/glutamate symporter [Labrys wisconsinensis]
MKKVLAMTLAAALVAGATLSTTGDAEARRGRNGAAVAGAAAGLVGGLLLGGALAQRPAYGYEVEPEPVYVEPACYWTRQQVRNTYDYGYHWERVRVCD